MLTRAADRLESALRGGAVDPGAVDDLDMAHQLADLDHLLVPLGPPPEFVNRLYQRLLDEPPVAAPEPRTAASHPAIRPRVVSVGGRRGRGLQVAVAGVVALLALAGVVAAAGRSSLPGQPLYAARQLVDRARVALGGSDQGRGLRLLDVAQHHVDDALELSRVPSRSTTDLRAALTDGLAATQEANQTLVADFAARTDPQSLTAIDAFAGRMLPATAGLAQTAPDVADTVTTFRSGVEAMRDEALRLLSACTVCGAASTEAQRQLGTLTPTGVPTDATGSPSSTGVATSTGSTGQTGPTTAPSTTNGGGSSVPTSSTSGPAPGPAPQTSPPSPGSPSSPGAPGSTRGGTGGGSVSVGPTTADPPTQVPTPSASVLPAPTSALPPVPTVVPPTPTLGATVTLGSVTTSITLP